MTTVFMTTVVMTNAVAPFKLRRGHVYRKFGFTENLKREREVVILTENTARKS